MFALPARIDLTSLPFQFDAGFVALEDMKIAERLAIENRFGRHDRAPKASRGLSAGAVGSGLLRGQFEGQFAGDDLPQRDVGEGRTRSRFDERTMAQPKLAHAPGDNVDQQLLIRDHLSCFLQELSGHISQ